MPWYRNWSPLRHGRLAKPRLSPLKSRRLAAPLSERRLPSRRQPCLLLLRGCTMRIPTGAWKPPLRRRRFALVENGLGLSFLWRRFGRVARPPPLRFAWRAARCPRCAMDVSQSLCCRRPHHGASTASLRYQRRLPSRRSLACFSCAIVLCASPGAQAGIAMPSSTLVKSPAGAIRKFSTEDSPNCIAARRGEERACSGTCRRGHRKVV